MALIMTKVLHLSSRWNKFLVSLFLSIQFFLPWVAGCHLIIWVVFHKTISSLFFSLLVFQQLRSSICCKRAPSRSCFPSFIPFHSYFCSGGFVMWLSSIFLFLSEPCSFHDYPFNRSVVTFLLKFFSPYQDSHLFSIGVLSEIFLTPCYIHWIVSEEVCCDFIKYLLILPSSYSIPFLFNRSAARSCSSLFLFF